MCRPANNKHCMLHNRTHALLLSLLHPLLALPTSSPSALTPKVWVGLVRCLQSMAQWLAKAQDPSLVQQVTPNLYIRHAQHSHMRLCSLLVSPARPVSDMRLNPFHTPKTKPKQALALLTQSLSLPSCCPYTVEAARTLASRCAPLLLQSDPVALIPLLAALHTTALTAEEASTLTGALLPLLLPSSSNCSLDPLTHPVLQRLALAADNPPESYLPPSPAPSDSSERHRLLADVAIAAALLRRLPPTAALDFLSQVRTPSCTARLHYVSLSPLSLHLYRLLPQIAPPLQHRPGRRSTPSPSAPPPW